MIRRTEAPSSSYVLTIVCVCRDWSIEPDLEGEAALDAGLTESVEEG